MSEKKFKRGDVVKVTIDNKGDKFILRGIVKEYYNPVLIGIMCKDPSQNYRAYENQVESINGLNIFDILTKKGYGF